MAKLPIESRQEFFDVLAQTTRDAADFAKRWSGFAPYQSIEQQLIAMQNFTAGGRTPTDTERDRICIGIIAIRELDPEADPAIADFIERLHELEGYFREWPKAP